MPIRRFGRPGLIGTAARTAVIAGTAQATTGAIARRQAQRAASQQPQYAPESVAAAPVAPAAAAPASDQDDLVAKLERLAGLHASGVLTDAEFAAAEAAALG